MRSQPSEKPSFRRLLHLLFKPSGESPYSGHAFTTFAFRVLLEGLQSLIADSDGDASAVGVPGRVEIRGALRELYQNIIGNPYIPESDRLETILRWHMVCLDTIIDSSLLCRYLCKQLGVKQHLWSERKESLVDLDNNEWTSSSDGRKALLHAIAIHDIVEQLPRGRAHAIHMPSSLFSAATVYAAFSIAGSHTVKVPYTAVWDEVLVELDEPFLDLAQFSSPELDSDTIRFVRGKSLFGIGARRNLLYDLNSIEKLFRCLSSQWGIASDMEEVVDQWIKACR